ncbi:aldehyde dehydrogenase [bacterium]|nr:aldehyde dehydrogenase [bacterium]
MGKNQVVSVNPATGETLETFPAADARQVREAVEKARRAQKHWARTPLADRRKIFSTLARLIRDREAELVHALTEEQGKVLREAQWEVPDAAVRIDYFVSAAAAALEPEEGVVPGRFKFRNLHKPVGVVGAIKPWNFPFTIPLWTIVPALLLGNAVVFKPSEHTPRMGRLIEELLRKAGLPEGVLEVVYGADETGKALVESDVEMISFVGSQAAGRDIMRASAAHLRKLALELGGKDPMIVCADADFDAAVAGAVSGSFRNAGQVCCSAERIFVEAAIFDRFVEAAAEKTRALKIGPGLDPSTDMGPMISDEQRRRTAGHLHDAKGKSRRVIEGGQKVPDRGFFLAPSIVVDPSAESKVMAEETFGPIMTLVSVTDASEAVRRANETMFGLTASVWTRDLERGAAIAGELEAGTVAVNQPVGSVAQCPWGGVKHSGIGRLLGIEGMREFTQTVNLRAPL